MKLRTLLTIGLSSIVAGACGQEEAQQDDLPREALYPASVEISDSDLRPAGQIRLQIDTSLIYEEEEWFHFSVSGWSGSVPTSGVDGYDDSSFSIVAEGPVDTLRISDGTVTFTGDALEHATLRYGTESRPIIRAVAELRYRAATPSGDSVVEVDLVEVPNDESLGQDVDLDLSGPIVATMRVTGPTLVTCWVPKDSPFADAESRNLFDFDTDFDAPTCANTIANLGVTPWLP